MADGKKSFVIYCDLIHTVSKMPDEKAGQLFKHILDYVNDLNPVTYDLVIQLTFEPIKQQFKRDLAKWETTREGRIAAGKASAESRKQNQQMLTNVKNVEQTSTNPTVNVNVNGTVNGSVNVNDIKERKKEFADKLTAFMERYDKPLLKDFFNYWTEHSENGKKMRFEKESVFDMALRLSTWAKRSKPSKPEKMDLSNMDYNQKL